MWFISIRASVLFWIWAEIHEEKNVLRSCSASEGIAEIGRYWCLQKRPCLMPLFFSFGFGWSLFHLWYREEPISNGWFPARANRAFKVLVCCIPKDWRWTIAAFICLVRFFPSCVGLLPFYFGFPVFLAKRQTCWQFAAIVRSTLRWRWRLNKSCRTRDCWLKLREVEAQLAWLWLAVVKLMHNKRLSPDIANCVQMSPYQIIFKD